MPSQALNGRIDSAMAVKGQKHDIQNITLKTKDRATLTPLKTGGGLRYYGIIAISGALVAHVMLLLLQTW